MLAPYPYWEILSRILFGAHVSDVTLSKNRGSYLYPLGGLKYRTQYEKKMCSKFRVCNTILLFFM